MSIEIIKEDLNEIVLRFEKIDTLWLSTLRRIMISEIPTLAIETVFIENNTSSIHDEFLSHRLGLLPIICEKDVFSIGDKDDSPNQFQFLLEKENKDKEGYIGVYSNDLVPIPNEITPFHVVTYPDTKNGILISKLAKGEKIKVRCIANTGIGKQHAKWSPVCAVSYEQCYEKTEPIDEGVFQMLIETNGSFPPLPVFEKSLSVLKNKINSLQNILSKQL